MAKIGYMRVSTDAQSLARQDLYMQGVQPDKIFSEKASGKGADRPALLAMLDYVREGDTVYVESISRLARSTADLLRIVRDLEAKNVELISDKEEIDTTTPQGRFVLTVFSALYELERGSMLQRTQEGIAAAKAEGKRFGRPPIEKPPEFSRIAAAQQRGDLSAKEAANRLGMSRTSFYKLLASQ